MIRVKRQEEKRAVTGFRLPMIEYEEDSLDIRDKIVVDPDNTYFMTMTGADMESYGISGGDILVVDRTLKPVNGAIVTFFYSGGFYTREYCCDGGRLLMRGTARGADISIGNLEEMVLFGVVTVVLKNMLPAGLRKGRYAHVCSC